MVWMPYIIILLTIMFISLVALAIRGYRLQREQIAARAYQVVGENLGDGILVLDTQSKILDLNPAAQSLFGCLASEVAGQPVEHIWPGWVPEPRSVMLGDPGDEQPYDVRFFPFVEISRGGGSTQQPQRTEPCCCVSGQSWA